MAASTGSLTRILGAPADAMLAQRGHLFGWVPVCIGIGIGGYLTLRAEPAWPDYALLAVVVALAGALVRPLGTAFGPLTLAVTLIGIGAGLAALRTHAVAAPVLGFRYYGAIEGRVVSVDKSASDAVRLTLDRVRLDRVAPGRTPDRVRVSLHGDQTWVDPSPGMTVMMTGHLGPPSGPVEPGDFDFRRHAWFDGLGGIGYTRNPLLLVAVADRGLPVDQLRAQLAQGVRARIPGDAGGFAAAVTTGDRFGLSQPATEAMRASNLYHLISISGMHMGMLASFVFGFIRFGVAAIPPLALRVPSRKIAALVALPAAAFYLILAGRDIPTERAFVTVAVMLVAILLDRRALTLRSVAIAALIVLVLRPESLVNPGFQMSFAAVVALVFAFGHMPHGGVRPLWQRIVLPAATLLLSSLVAGTATAPYAAAHFNRVAHYGLVANLLAVPAMGFLVMPAAVMSAVLTPLGLEAPAMWVMQVGARWILWVAQTVAGWDGAVSAVPRPPAAVLPLLTLGLLFVVLWQGRTRLAGLIPVIVAALLWLQADRPVLLVAESGALVGLMTPDGRALSKATGDSFTASLWLENDGVIGTQLDAATRGDLQPVERVLRFEVGETRVVLVTGKTALAALVGCGGADILIANTVDEVARPCDVYDLARLRETGALSGAIAGGRLALTSVSDVSGRRLWHGDGAGDGLLLPRLRSEGRAPMVAVARF